MCDFYHVQKVLRRYAALVLCLATSSMVRTSCSEGRMVLQALPCRTPCLGQEMQKGSA